MINSQSGQNQEHPDTVERPGLRAELSVEFRGGRHLSFRITSQDQAPRFSNKEGFFALGEIYYCRDTSLFELQDSMVSIQATPNLYERQAERGF